MNRKPNVITVIAAIIVLLLIALLPQVLLSAIYKLIGMACFIFAMAVLLLLLDLYVDHVKRGKK